MVDLVVRGATVVDGTGAPGRVTDVAVVDGRVAEVGDVPDGATRTIDADGLLLTPGSSTRTRTTTRSSSGTRARRRATCTASPR